MIEETNRILIRGGRVYDASGDVHQPPVRDVLIEGSRIAAVTAPGEDEAAKAALLEAAQRGGPGAPTVIEAREHLVIPGLVNAHYHSYDVLQKGMLEDMPFDVWALHSQPIYFGKRSKAELRARVLVGALEALKNGITTVQDMNTLVPRDEETLDTILEAYDEIGIRVVFSIAMRDLAALDIAPFLSPDIPAEILALIAGKPNDPDGRDRFRRSPDRAPTRPGPCFSLGGQPVGTAALVAPALLDGVCDLAGRHRLADLHPRLRNQGADRESARDLRRGRRLDDPLPRTGSGLFKHRTTIAHGVWLMPDEMEILAAHGGKPRP